MTELTSREIVERFAQAQANPAGGAGDEYLAEDLIEDYPQSGERIRGRANRRAIFDNYPGRADQEFGPNDTKKPLRLVVFGSAPRTLVGGLHL